MAGTWPSSLALGKPPLDAQRMPVRLRREGYIFAFADLPLIVLGDAGHTEANQHLCVLRKIKASMVEHGASPHPTAWRRCVG